MAGKNWSATLLCRRGEAQVCAGTRLAEPSPTDRRAVGLVSRKNNGRGKNLTPVVGTSVEILRCAQDDAKKRIRMRGLVGGFENRGERGQVC